MFIWGLFIFGSFACLSMANPVAQGPPVILRGGSVDARSMRLLMSAHPRGGEIRPECLLNPAAMGLSMRGDDSPYFNPDDSHQRMLVDEEGAERILPETPEENAVPAESDNTLPEVPEETTPEVTTPAEEERTTVETPTVTTGLPDEVESTPETTEETSTHHEEESTTVEAAEEHSEHPEEGNANPGAETPVEEPNTAEELSPREEPANKDCEKATPGSRRRSKARPVETVGDDEEEAPRKSHRGGSVYKDFFPVTFGGAGPSRTRGQEEGTGGRGQGSVTAIANSFSQGRGAIASSSAVAHGSPDAGQYRNSRRSRYRL